jgi:hypothetical protein
MSANGEHPDVELRPFAGSITREHPVLQLRAGAMDGRVVITPLSGFRGGGSYRAMRFEVAAHWHGPGLPGLPPTDQAVDASDTLLVGDLELARAIAMAAVDELRALRAPDLRTLLRRFDTAE